MFLPPMFGGRSRSELPMEEDEDVALSYIACPGELPMEEDVALSYLSRRALLL